MWWNFGIANGRVSSGEHFSALFAANENRSRPLGRECDEAHFSEEKGLFSEKVGSFQ